ncbi:Csu type fimbrial protein [Sphingomonas parapaucimobilis]|uniref:Csu type fimbrial protein n=1 Tax=Sphingomonas parapaucimobilis TaxID=28213 RepID=UPI00321C3077
MMRILFPLRAFQRLVAAIASCGMLGQGVLSAALSLPVLMMATPAQAAAACAAAGTQVVAIYQSNTAETNPYITSPYLTCKGVPNQNLQMICVNPGTAQSSAGMSSDNFFQARSATGAVIKFDLQYSFDWGGNGAGNGFYNVGRNSSSNANGVGAVAALTADANGNYSGRATAGWNNSSGGPRLVLPQQAVAAGDYTAMVSYGVQLRAWSDWAPWSVCSQTVYATFTFTYPILIRVNGSCDLASVAPIDFGQIVATNGALTSKNASYGMVPFYITSVCVQNQSYKLSISDGANVSGSGNYRRRMVNGSSYIAYGLFTDSGAATPFPAGGVSLTGTGAATDMQGAFYAQLAPNQSPTGLAAGAYNDTLIATVTW